MINGAVFDADGTLLDSMHIWHELGKRYLESLSIKASDDLSQRLYALSIEQGCHYIKERYGLEKSESEIQSGILGIIEGFYRNEVKIKDGVKEFLSAMKTKGVPMVIATSGDRDLLSSALERNKIAHYFDEIFTCSELETDKHRPKIFLECSKFLGLEPEKVGIFEDALFALETAKKAGFVTFGVEDNSNYHDRERIKAISDYYIKTFKECV